MIKLFSYLAAIDRLSTHGNLFAKNCAPSAACEACGEAESGHHLFFVCAAAAAVWALLAIPAAQAGASLWTLEPPTPLPIHVWRAGLATLLWHIWKARNYVVFNSRSTSPSAIIRRAAEDLLLWSARFPTSDQDDLQRLCALFQTCAM